MERFISDSPEETVEIGKKIASYLKAGDCVLYTGEMGAGKTHLTKGIAEYFGSTDDVTSPTFALVNEYEGDVPICHFDLFIMIPSQYVVLLYEKRAPKRSIVD